MISFLRVAARHLVRSRTASIINIAGLSIGLAVSIVMMLWITRELSVDTFHTHRKDIVRLMTRQKRDGNITVGKVVSGRVAPLIRESLPELKYVVRTSQQGPELLSTGNSSIYEQGFYAEPDYFNMMTWPAVQGNPAAVLREGSSVVITESTAKKLFGNEDAMGKTIIHANTHSVKVGAVVRDIPSNSTTRFGIVLPFSILEKENDWVQRWDYVSLVTWLQLKPGADLAGLNAKLKNLMKQQHNEDAELFAYPMADIYLHAQFKNGQPSGGGKIVMIYLLGAIGLTVLLIACINFMNLSTARSEFRAREVGVRKTLGASRARIIFQFLGEAMVMTGIALILAVCIAAWIMPWFSRATHTQLSFTSDNIGVWASILGVGLLTGLIAGSYPAFYLSRFRPVKVLKGPPGAQKGGSVLRKTLVTFQFFISVFLIISTLVFYMQVRHVETRPIGYESSHLIHIPARGAMAEKFQLVKNELASLPGIESISGGSNNLLRFGGSTDGINWPGKTPDQNFMVYVTSVQYDWVKTAGMRLIEGREFSPAYGADTNACLLNREAVRRMGLKSPVVGTKLGNSTVIGVIDDFIFNDPSRAYSPLMVQLSTGSTSNILIRLRNDADWQANLDHIGQAFKKLDPKFPFEFHFVKEEYEKDFSEMHSAGMLLNVTGGIAILISCMGLFGLSAFLTERRTKEVGVRKVLGASVARIWFLLTREFLQPVLIACLLVFPIAGWTLTMALQEMDYHITLTWWIFAAAGMAAIAIALVTVSFEGIKAAIANPAKALRTE